MRNVIPALILVSIVFAAAMVVGEMPCRDVKPTFSSATLRGLFNHRVDARDCGRRGEMISSSSRCSCTATITTAGVRISAVGPFGTKKITFYPHFVGAAEIIALFIY
jgi:hypothetical protein